MVTEGYQGRPFLKLIICSQTLFENGLAIIFVCQTIPGYSLAVISVWQTIALAEVSDRFAGFLGSVSVIFRNKNSPFRANKGQRITEGVTEPWYTSKKV